MAPNTQNANIPDKLSVWDMLDLVPFGVYVVDIKSHEIIYVNLFYRKLQETATTGNAKCYQMIYQADQPCLSCKIPQLVDATGRPNGRIIASEIFNEAADHWYQMQEGAMTMFDGRTVMYSIAIDIAEIKEMQNTLAAAHAELALKNQQLERLSVTDRLTGLYNRRKLDDILLVELERAQRTKLPLSVFIADVDKFKSVNDNYGHQIGDKVLVGVAEIMQKEVRKLDSVGRWGGEEFMGICSNTNLAGASLVAEKLRAAIEAHEFPVVGHKTCSFGVAECQPGETPEAMIKRADDALYRAKNTGRNQVIAG